MISQKGYYPVESVVICRTSDVRVVEITLGPGTQTPPHEHTNAEEVCYCLHGELTCQSPGAPPDILREGQRRVFRAGDVHMLRNDGDIPCRLLLIHTGGQFDFVIAPER